MTLAARTIGTHSGTFHADEALACAMLRMLPAWAAAPVVRSRDPAVLGPLGILVDVGGEYDPDRLRFDHHQRGFEETFSPRHDIKLSSAGLVYKHFGRDVVREVLGWPAGDARLEIVFARLYDEMILGFDGVDNGVNRYPADVKPRYKDHSSIASRVARLNPAWNETDAVDLDARFAQAVELTRDEFLYHLKHIACEWLPAKEIVAKAFDARKAVDPSGRVLLIESYAPWKTHIFDIEQERNTPDTEKPFYVIYCDTSGSWRVQSGAFDNRKPLPEAWRGVRDDQLSKLSGVPGCIFVHATGFIGGNATKEGVLKMAELALKH